LYGKYYIQTNIKKLLGGLILIEIVPNKTDWVRTFCNIANEMKQHSTCCRLKVGALLVKKNRIISTGYNGVPSGMEHCDKQFSVIDKNREDFMKIHGEFSRLYELHAEQNAIVFAGKNGVNTENSDLYITTAPCSNCAKLIVAAGIKNVYYIDNYDRDMSGPDLLDKLGISCYHVKLT
jgi:dCMP deaminase